ncbi:MAG: hypothetical protein OIF51_17105 [Cellvibrionaceae bacterium]|nr:hypothetical protein [Cellvibrionaceae bacterium]
MVIFVITREGFIELEPIVSTGLYPVWIGAGVLSSEEVNFIRSRNIDITDFSYRIDPGNKQELEAALSIISEHHPGEKVWVDCQPEI